MPFDYDDYQQKVNTLTTEQLHKEWENYTRQLAGGATSTATSVLFSPLTGGISLLGLGLSTPRIHNARKKRDIIEAGLQARGATHSTRKRDVIAPMAVAGTLGGLTLGLAGPGADMIAGEVAGHGIEYAVSHAALDATGAVMEHTHDEHSKKKAEHKLQTQYQAFQQQYVQEQANLNGHPQLVGAEQTGIQAGAPQFQQTFGQEQKYEFVPIPARFSSGPPPQQQQIVPPIPQPPVAFQPTSYQQQQTTPSLTQPHISFQPASHLQQLSSAVAPLQIGYQPQFDPQLFSTPLHQPQVAPLATPAPQYQDIQQPEKVLITVPGLSAQAGPIDSSYFPEKSAAYAAAMPRLGQDSSSSISISPCATPLPAYSEPLDGRGPINDMKKEVPLPAMTMDEEIAFLKARLLAMELEKRGEVLDINPPEIVAPQPQHASPNSIVKVPEPIAVTSNLVSPSPTIQLQSTISPPVVSQHLQSYPPPPLSPLLPPRSPSIQSVQYVPPLPPGSTTLQNSYYQLPLSNTPYQPPALLNVYQPQNYPPPPPSPHTYNPQTYAQPQNTAYSPQNYPPPPKSPNLAHPQYQRQDSGYFSTTTTPLPQPTPQNQSLHVHGRNASQVALPFASPPPPYFPPPPSMQNIGAGGKGYFPQPQNHETAPGYQGTQGWQWGAPAPKVGGELNYGPPPPIPEPWRGQ